MSQKRKIFFTSVILGAIATALILFSIRPLFSQIGKESRNIIFQRHRLLELENKVKNFSEAESEYKKYQSYSEKINSLLVDSSEPLDFIEFLEKEAENSLIGIEIMPSSAQEVAGDPWPSMKFQIIAAGEFPNFLNYLEKLESAPYLIEVLNLDISQKTEKEAGVEKQTAATILIKAYAK